MNIQHQDDHCMFVLSQNGQEATLKYQLTGESQVTFLSTYVPFSLRGQGLAEALVRAGLTWARDKGYQISSRCWYVDKFLD